MNLIEEIKNYLVRLFPIARSITGNGNRETLGILSELIPLEIHEVPSLTKVYDWEIPLEWSLTEAWIKNSRGEKIIDYSKNNLHVLNYSVPVNKKLKLETLLPNLYYSESLPDAIPYKTSYYKDNWGFCLSYNDFKKHFNYSEEYEIYIESDFIQGSLTYADLLVKGASQKEILISTYICHPSMANDNLSGMVLTALLAAELKKLSLNYSYRFVFVPETIGAITYCFHNINKIKNILGGFVISCVAGPGNYGYKQTYLGNHIIDRIVQNIFKEKDYPLIQYPFEPEGSDERQYSSPGLRIPIGLITKDKFHEYSYYHTSLDNLEFIGADNLLKTLEIYLEVISRLDKSYRFVSNEYKCEPFLGKHGLYPSIGRTGYKINSDVKVSDDEILLGAIKWILFYADGESNIQDIYERTKIPFETLAKAFAILLEKGLIKKNL